MSQRSCFFIGHRDAPDDVYPTLVAEVQRHIVELDVREFIVGKYGAFDHLAAKAVREMKEKYPQVSLTLLLPYHPAERPVQKPEGYDSTYYPDGMERVPRRFAIVRANRYMVAHVDYLIAYVWHTASNARELVEYAQRRQGKGLIQVTVLPRVERSPVAVDRGKPAEHAEHGDKYRTE